MLFGRDSFTSILTRELRRYDSKLFAARNSEGVVCVMRKNKKFKSVAVSDGFRLLSLTDAPDYVFALTDTWALNGQPIEWGPLVVLKHLREIDLAHDSKVLEKMDEKNEKVDQIKMKDMRNQHEAFVSDNKRSFQKVFSEFNMSNVSMDEKRKRVLEKKGRI